MKEEWAVEIKSACTRHGIPFFFKQWGGARKKKNGRLLEGRIWSEMPTVSA
jgi:protein gp37